MRLAIIVGWMLLALAAGLGSAHADKRVALVIGNGAYRNALALPNPTNDAADVAATLKREGFETIVGLDLDKNGMDDVTIRFARAARDADVAMFYYSGHAMQFGGANYLMPVDARLTDEADLRRMIRVDDIVADLQQARTLRILVLDSCRDNPLADELRRSIGIARAVSWQRGLARIDAPQGMILAYATQSGRTAEDGTGRNSPYTAAFLRHIGTADEIGTVFRQISADVYNATGHKQLPELSLSFIGEYFLLGRPQAQAGAIVAAPPPGVEAAAQAWAVTKDTASIAVLEDFIRQFGDTPYGSMARARLGELKKNQVAIVAPPTAPQAAPAPPAEPSHATSPLSGGALVQQIKKELGRVGCYDGPLDDKWPANEIIASIKKFATYAKVSISATEPTTELLNAIQGRFDRICPFQCSAGRVEKEGRCVAKSCPAGQHLSEQGNCIGRAVATQHPTETAEPARPASTAPGSAPTGARPKSELASNPGDTKKTYPEGGQMCGPSGCRTVPKGCVGKKANGRSSGSDDGAIYC